MEVFGNEQKKHTYYDFDGVTLPIGTSLTFDVKLQNPERSIACAGEYGSCRITYSQTFTPEFIDTQPN